jgi:uncharacterized membrane protein YtjA (UPF0391 family)
MHLQHSLEQLVGKHNSYLNIIKELHMLHYSVVFLVIALIAAVFGFGGIAAGAEEIAKILFFIFAAMAIIGFIVSLMKKK